MEQVSEKNFTSEEQDIITRSKTAGGYMKAPNGQVTNLNEKQWVQVRTQAFKDWFGDWENEPESASKVIDENGEPLVVYHGTRSNDDFYVFDSKKGNPSNQGGHYFSNNREFAAKFGKVIKEFFLNIKDPALGGFEGSGAVMAPTQYRDGGIFTKRNTDRYAEKGTKEYIVFNPNQIKSATDNTGEFSIWDDDIRFRKIEDDISFFASRYNLEEADVRKYAQSMQNENLGGASYAIQEIRRKIRIDNSNDSFAQFSKRFAPIKESLYKEFGNVDELRNEVIRTTMEERNALKEVHKQMLEKTEAEKERLQEFQDMCDEQLDSEYFIAIDENNEPRMRDLVNEAAHRRGYIDIDSNYQGVGAWAAPADPGYENVEARRADVEEYSPDVNIEDIAKGYSPQPDDYFTHLKAYGKDTPEGKESAQAINKAINEIRSTGNIPLVKAYRAVPTDIKENTLRNGDWVSLSPRYAEMHGNNRLEGKYRIIEQKVPANELWWDGNDSNEWGFDDGKEYRYKNTENNRKLNDLITRDEKGNIIPLSQRFNSINDDIRFRFIGEKGAVTLDIENSNQHVQQNLAIAKEMEIVGKQAETIKIATGWERGADQFWRYETTDFKVSKDVRLFHIGKNTWSCMLSELNSYDTLFDAYPSLAGLSVIIKDGIKKGSFNGIQIEISGIFMDENGKLRADKIDDFERILNHEIQHAIQDIEGFAPGSSFEQFINTKEEIIRDLNFFTSGDLLDKGTVITDSASVRKALDKTIPYTDISLRTGYEDKLKRVAYKYGYEDLEGLLTGFDTTPSPMEQYYRTAGEVEARNVDSRINLTFEQRRTTLAVSTEDIARSEQIFLSRDAQMDELSRHASFLAQKQHIPVEVIRHINEVSSPNIRGLLSCGKDIRGWYDIPSERICLYLPHARGKEDIAHTLLHEGVAHYGLRKFVGNEHMDEFLDEIFDGCGGKLRGEITNLAETGKLGIRTATEEYLAHMAENGVDVSVWDKICLAFRNLIRKLGFSIEVTERELKAILVASQKNLKEMGTSSMPERNAKASFPTSSSNSEHILQSSNCKTLLGDVSGSSGNEKQIGNFHIMDKSTGKTEPLNIGDIALDKQSPETIKELLSGKQVKMTAKSGTSQTVGLSKTSGGWGLQIGKQVFSSADSGAEI